MKMVLRQNWYSRPLWSHSAVLITMGFYALMSVLSRIHFEYSLSASGEWVFQRQEWWRLWSSVWAHGDLTHFLANTPLFLLFTYLITRFFGAKFMLMGIFIGGGINFITLLTMPEAVKLVGMSGVVHWLGALWVTLYILIDRRYSWRTRFGSSLFLCLMLFLPESYRPEVSYVAHAVGFISGVMTGLLIYLVKQRTFQSHERWEFTYEPPVEFDWMEKSESNETH
jgi:rhomboid protease GluP